MKRTLLMILALLFPSIALAQVDYCQPGRRCVTRDFNSTRKGGNAFCAQGPNATWKWDTGTSVATLGWTSSTDNRCAAAGTTLISMSINENVVASNSSGGWRAGTAGFQAADGSLAGPSFTWNGDGNTGFYRTAADTFAVVTGGARSFQFEPTSGTMTGVSASPRLRLDATAGACLDYASTSAICMANQVITVSGGTSGISVTGGGSPTSWVAPGAGHTFQVDSNTGNLYWQSSTTQRASPFVDWGGEPHFVLQRRLFGLDMGQESSNTPTFYPVAPRLGASSATVTVVDALAASTIVVGTAPRQFDARVSNTDTVIGSISSVVTSAFIRRAGAAPRWCQKVSINSTNSVRYWLGMANALPGANDSPANGHASFRYSTNAGDSFWMACYGNGVGTTCTSTTKAPTSGTTDYDTLCIDCREGMSTACVWWVNGVATNRVTSGLSTGSPWFPYYSVEARAASSRAIYAGPVSVELY